MDPIAINTDYNTVKGMYKTDDIVTPKGQFMHDNSQLTDYAQNFKPMENAQPNKTSGGKFNYKNSMYKTQTTAAHSSPPKDGHSCEKKPPLAGSSKFAKGSTTTRHSKFGQFGTIDAKGKAPNFVNVYQNPIHKVARSQSRNNLKRKKKQDKIPDLNNDSQERFMPNIFSKGDSVGDFATPPNYEQNSLIQSTSQQH